MTNQRHKAAGRDIEINILQHQAIVAVGKRDMIDTHRPAAQRLAIFTPRLTRFVHELEDALARHDRLLQH